MRGSVVSRGFNISYRVEGRGASLVLLHGGSMWADNWWDAGYADELGGEYRVIAVDFLGHGDSDKPHDPADYHSDLMVSDVIAVLDAEQVKCALVWGYSMGATHAARLAVREPGRVAALVFGGEAPLPATEDRAEWMASRAESVRTVAGMAAFFREMGASDDSATAYAVRNDPAAFSAVMLAGATEERTDAEDVQAPSLWYQGAEDAPFTQESLEIAARCGVETHLIPGADHVAAFNRAHDALVFVRPFLERYRSSATGG
jgi:pimeloyl-ACP methyl ester carboxylesterase